MKKFILTITGPSASGKTTLESHLCESGMFAKVISTTTRPARDGEIDGVDYHFVSEDEFNSREMIERVKFGGNLYGISTEELNRQFSTGKPVVIVAEPDGVNQIRKYAKRHSIPIKSVFLTAAIEFLMGRLVLRGIKDGLTPDKIMERVEIMDTTERFWKDDHEWDMKLPAFSEASEGFVAWKVVSFASPYVDMHN